MPTLRFETEPGFFVTADTWGDPTHPPVLLLHGGGQTRHSWGDTARLLAEAGWYAIALDARGHGDSDWSAESQYGIDYLVSDLNAIIQQLGTLPVLVGASMGGLTALLAVGESAPPVASALVLVDVAPRTEQKGIERIFTFMSANPNGFASLNEAADAVAGYLPHRSNATPDRPANHRRLEKNLRLKPGPNGGTPRYYWHWDPEFLRVWHDLAHMAPTPAGETQKMQQEERLFDAARHLNMPTLIVRGGMSDVVSEKVMTEFLDVVPHAQSINVADASHMVAGDSNHAFTKAVINFLKAKA
jgi:pimeloyl-ACP methyl ester carboxylesterase